MLQNFSSTKLPTVAATNPTGHTSPFSLWQNVSRITADDASSASWGAYLPGQGANIVGSAFGFQQLPESAIIDGILVSIEGSNTGCWGDVTLNIPGTTGKSIGALNGTFGGTTDKWGASTITPAHIAALTVSADTEDLSGGDGIASMDYMSVTVFWHIELENTPADVPTRTVYKAYSRDGKYLGLLPKVTSKLVPVQDINSAGSSIEIVCGKFLNNDPVVAPLQDNTGASIQTQSGLDIMTRATDTLVATGDSDDDAIFKNSNRVEAWVYNQWYPNGKIVFSGQVNKVNFKYSASESIVRLLAYSDGLDLDNYIARGYPFNYTTDVDNYVGGVAKVVQVDGGKGAGWQVYGQSWRTGAAVDNVGAIRVGLNGTANVTVEVRDAVNGNVIGSVTKPVSGYWHDVRFEFASLIPVTPSTEYFFALWVDPGQSIEVAGSPASSYANGTMYESIYSGGSGGGSFGAIAGDLGFTTYSGVPTTTTTYSTDDPVTEMMHNILLDYNARGGDIVERDFVATGLSLTYTFNSATIYDALKKVLEMSPAGYYSYIDLGTGELDIKPISATPDFTIVKGKGMTELDIGLSIEQIKNYLLLSGGEVTPGVNLFRDYPDADSISKYGLRTASKSDNRITQTVTADAIGDSFIDENSEETQETTLTVLNTEVDITLLTPGKTIGFKNFGNFIDELVLQIARREPNYSDGKAVLTLGRLPIRTTDEIQRIMRELQFEQTINNPSAPS